MEVLPVQVAVLREGSWLLREFMQRQGSLWVFFPGLEASDFSLLIRILEFTPLCSATCWLYNLLYGCDFKVELFKAFTLFRSPTFAYYEYSCLQKLPSAVVYVSHPWWDLFLLITWCASPACLPPSASIVCKHSSSFLLVTGCLAVDKTQQQSSHCCTIFCVWLSIHLFLFVFFSCYLPSAQSTSLHFYSSLSVWQSPICNPAGPQLK